jgi:hypothetical protein
MDILGILLAHALRFNYSFPWQANVFAKAPAVGTMLLWNYVENGALVSFVGNYQLLRLQQRMYLHQPGCWVIYVLL